MFYKRPEVFLSWGWNVHYSQLTSNTEIPTAQAMGLPPKVLKWSAWDMVLAMAGVVTTAAKGNPLPMLLAMVTISGITSWASKPQKWSPVRPKPLCT